jgi:hypothetical protein
VGLRAVLDIEVRGKNPLPLPGIEPRLSSMKSVTILTEQFQVLQIRHKGILNNFVKYNYKDCVKRKSQTLMKYLFCVTSYTFYMVGLF